MRILVIGGTGLIGTAVTRRLLHEGNAVTVFVRGRTTSRLSLQPEWILGDRHDDRDFQAKMRAAGRFDCVVDMLGYSAADAQSAVRAFGGGQTRYIFCSSVAVYGGPATRYPITEAEPLRPTGRYGRAKAECEQVLREAHETGKLPVTILRLSQTYGEGGTIVHTFGWGAHYLDRIRRRQPIVVPGDGSSLWSACHIDDVASAFASATTHPATASNVYNVASDEWMTRNDYHACVAAALRAPAPTLVHIPTALLAIWAPRRALAAVEFFQYPGVFDCAAARRDLGFRPVITFRDGVRRTLEHLEAHAPIGSTEDGALEDRIVALWSRFVRDQASCEDRPEAESY